jgi:hypothetical protein
VLTLSETDDGKEDEVEVDEVDADDAANMSLANLKYLDELPTNCKFAIGWLQTQIEEEFLLY